MGQKQLVLARLDTTHTQHVFTDTEMLAEGRPAVVGTPVQVDPVVHECTGASQRAELIEQVDFARAQHQQVIGETRDLAYRRRPCLPCWRKRRAERAPVVHRRGVQPGEFAFDDIGRVSGPEHRQDRPLRPEALEQVEQDRREDNGDARRTDVRELKTRRFRLPHIERVDDIVPVDVGTFAGRDIGVNTEACQRLLHLPDADRWTARGSDRLRGMKRQQHPQPRRARRGGFGGVHRRRRWTQP